MIRSICPFYELAALADISFQELNFIIDYIEGLLGIKIQKFINPKRNKNKLFQMMAKLSENKRIFNEKLYLRYFYDH